MKSTLALAHVQVEPVLNVVKSQVLGRPDNKKSHLSINDFPSGVEDSGVVHNLNVPWLQLFGDVELWTLSQLGHRPAKSNHKCCEKRPIGFSCQHCICKDSDKFCTNITRAAKTDRTSLLCAQRVLP